MKFYDREKELRFLKSAAALRVAVVGRRRIGKTRLVEEAFNDCLVLFVSAEKAESEIISGWVEEYPQLNLPKVKTLKEFFSFLMAHFKGVIFIDELQNVLKVNRSFVCDLQRLLDKNRQRGIVVSGSYIRTMKKLVENYKSPIFGRFDSIIKLRELDFSTVLEIMHDLGYNTEDTIKFYSVFGGIPKYYETMEKMPKKSVLEAINELFIFYPRPLCEEVKTTLKEEFGKDYKNFFSILSAISRGKNSLGEISDFVDREPTKLTKYLALLKEDFEIVNHAKPTVGNQKRGLYYLNFNLAEFWFRFIWRHQELLERNLEKELAAKTAQNINAFIGEKFEEICKQALEKLSEEKKLFRFERAGRQWGKIKGKPKGQNTYEIDIVTLNEHTKEILFAECKWKKGVNAEKALAELKEKAAFVQWNNQKRKEHYAIFAKSFKKRAKEKNTHCFDLKDLEKAFKK